MDPRRVTDPGEPSNRDPPTNTRTPPKGINGPFPEGRDESAQTMAEQGRPLPIAYGTVKLPVLCIEKLTPLQQDPPAWAAATFPSVGYLVSNGGNAYEVLTPGTSVTGPTGTAADSTDGGTAHWKFRQQLPLPTYFQRFIGAICEGQATTGLTLYWDKETYVSGDGVNFRYALNLLLGPDAANQVLPGAPGNPFEVSAYQHTVLVVPLATAIGMPSGTQKELPNIAMELKTVMFGVSTADVNAGDVVNDLLTHARRGVVWPSSRVDTSITGTAASGYRVYCDAAGFRFSMALQEQKTVLDWIDMILTATNSDAVWSGGALKIVPIGDQPIASPVYGATGYVPANTPVYDLTLNDFLDQDFPVQVTRNDDADCFNTWPIEFIDRSQAYARTTVEVPDQLDVDDRGGKRVAQTLALPLVFPNGTQATMLSKIAVKRSLKVRNTYTFRLAYWSMLLEPTDIVTLPVEVLGVKTAVRIRSVREDPGNGFTFTAEDYPAGVQAAAAYAPQAGDGYRANETGTTATIPTKVDGVGISVKDGTIPDAGGTRGGSVDNIWPNPTSEADPPAGAATTAAEWAGRLNAGAGAFAGSWVRQLAAAQNGQQLLGDTFGAGTRPATESALAFKIPCAPGEAFYIEGQAKWITVTGAQACGVDMHFLNAAGTQVGTASASTQNTGGTAAGWTKVSAVGTAPAAAVWVRFFCSMNSTLGAATAQYDAIYARRSINGGMVGDGSAWFAKAWGAYCEVDLGTPLGVLNSLVNVASVTTGGTYNGQSSVRITWNTPPASFAPGGSVIPVVVSEQIDSWTNPRRLTRVAVSSTWVDLQLFDFASASSAPKTLTGATEVFAVYVYLSPSTTGYSL